MKRAAFLLACALATGPSWAINKCTDADGKVSYQESKCAEGASAKAIKRQILTSQQLPLLYSWKNP